MQRPLKHAAVRTTRWVKQHPLVSKAVPTAIGAAGCSMYGAQGSRHLSAAPASPLLRPSQPLCLLPLPPCMRFAGFCFGDILTQYGQRKKGVKWFDPKKTLQMLVRSPRGQAAPQNSASCCARASHPHAVAHDAGCGGGCCWALGAGNSDASRQHARPDRCKAVGRPGRGLRHLAGAHACCNILQRFHVCTVIAWIHGTACFQSRRRSLTLSALPFTLYLLQAAYLQISPSYRTAVLSFWKSLQEAADGQQVVLKQRLQACMPA